MGTHQAVVEEYAKMEMVKRQLKADRLHQGTYMYVCMYVYMYVSGSTPPSFGPITRGICYSSLTPLPTKRRKGIIP